MQMRKAEAMKIEDQVCSADLAKRLKGLGVKQESYFEYCYIIQKQSWELFVCDPDDKVNPKLAAFTVAELGEMFPKYVGSGRKKYGFYCRDFSRPLETVVSLLEAEARAKMLVYLIEQGIVKP